MNARKLLLVLSKMEREASPHPSSNPSSWRDATPWTGKSMVSFRFCISRRRLRRSCLWLPHTRDAPPPLNLRLDSSLSHWGSGRAAGNRRCKPHSNRVAIQSKSILSSASLSSPRPIGPIRGRSNLGRYQHREVAEGTFTALSSQESWTGYDPTRCELLRTVEVGWSRNSSLCIRLWFKGTS